jgi:hypothetical protein
MKFVQVYDIDKPSASLDQHDFIGYSECTLGQIVAAGYSGLSLALIQKKTRYNPNKVPKQAKQSKGKIILVAEELVQFKEEVCLNIFILVVPPPAVYVLLVEVKYFLVYHKCPTAAKISLYLLSNRFPIDQIKLIVHYIAQLYCQSPYIIQLLFFFFCAFVLQPEVRFLSLFSQLWAATEG